MSQNKIKQIIKIFEQSNVTKMELEFEDIKISLEKPSQGFQEQIITEGSTKVKNLTDVMDEPEAVGFWVTSPLVGTYYEASSPTSKPFVSVGQEVSEGDVLCVIEAMKVMNEVKSTVSGVIEEIVVENESMVQFNQQLMRIRENDS
jgi:acetyl-CoA carboxylase biotin carboxyl carrier protein